MKICIIGAGMMGSALAFPARENGHDVALVGTPLDEEIIKGCRASGKYPKFDKKFPEGIEYFQFPQWKEAAKGIDFIICGVNSFGVDWFFENVLSDDACGCPVLSVTKGLIALEDGTLISYPEYWERALAEKGLSRKICAVGGPCTSYELVFGDQSFVAFCGKDMEILRMMKSAMETSYYHVLLTSDVIGLESAVALKNAYALGVALTIGLCQREHGDGCGLHYNSQAAAFCQAAREMKKLLKLQGASDDSESMGLGDLYVTVYGGRTRRLGILLGRGLDIDEALEQLEGVTLESLVITKRVTKAIRERAKRGGLNLLDFPLLIHIDDVLSGKKDPALPWDEFAR